MHNQTNEIPTLNDELQVRSLYNDLLESWNQNSAASYAGLFADDGSLVGFDGSQMNGREDIYEQVSKIFLNHKVGSYVSIVKEVRALSSTVYALHAVAGMVPAGQSDVKPEVNAIQTLIAVKQQDRFSIAVFQNTPAAFHGRPELKEQLTGEIRKVLTQEKHRKSP